MENIIAKDINRKYEVVTGRRKGRNISRIIHCKVNSKAFREKFSIKDRWHDEEEDEEVKRCFRPNASSLENS